MSRNELLPVGACVAATILCLGIASWGPSPLLNLAAAAPLVFYLPGWSVLRALRAEPEDWLGSVVLRVTLSLAIVLIAGLLLHLPGWITKQGWLAALGATIAVGCVTSAASGSRAASASDRIRSRLSRASFRPMGMVMMAAAIALAGAAIMLSIVLALRHHEFYYTQLWILPKKDAPDRVVVGLHNAEAGDESYAVELLVDRHLVESWSNVLLKPGETWKTEFRWVGFGEYPHAVQPMASRDATPAATISQRVALGANPRVEAVVYRANNLSAVYRYVWSAPQCATGDDARGRPPCEF
jgi:uncharacterized membrane protein